MFFVVAGGMLSRKQPPSSSASSSNTSDDDASTRINDALCSLASGTVALHHLGITGLMPPPTPATVASHGGARSLQHTRTRLMLIDSMLASSSSDVASTSAAGMYQEVLDIQKLDFTDEVTCEACWSIILKEMHRGRTEGIVHVLTGYPVEDIKTFFDDLRIRRPKWQSYIHPSLKPASQPSSAKGKEKAHKAASVEEVLLDNSLIDTCYAMLTDVVCELHAQLDLDQALVLLRIQQMCTPLAILFFRPPRARRNQLNFPLLLTFLAHSDYSPTYSAIQPLLGFDLQWVVKSSIEILCRASVIDMGHVVDHILKAIRPSSLSDPSELDIAQLCSMFSWVQPWSPRRYLARHPASPFLSYAIFLADRSERASRLLVERGLIRTIEDLYDQDFPDPRVREDDPYVQTREELYKLCLRLLSAVSRHCNLRDCVLLEELKADVRRCDRELSEQYFGVFWTD